MAFIFAKSEGCIELFKSDVKNETNDILTLFSQLVCATV